MAGVTSSPSGSVASHHFERLGPVGEGLGELRAGDLGELPALRGKPARQEHEARRTDVLGATTGDELHRPIDHFRGLPASPAVQSRLGALGRSDASVLVELRAPGANIVPGIVAPP